MSVIEKKILDSVTKHALIPSNQTIVVAVSGGPDSIALLHLIHSLLPDVYIYAVYIDHNLRPGEAAIERKLVEDQCKKISVESHVRFVDVPRAVEITGESIEACARKLRYRELKYLMRSVGAGAVAVGHTADDQAEEILIRLIRGSSLKGLSGMDYSNGQIIRPLLDIRKEEILDYLDNHTIAFCHDSSNDSKAFLRNRVRIDLLPFLEEQFNPSIRRTLIKTASILKDEDDYLHNETMRIFDSVVQQEPSFRSADDYVLSLSCIGLNNLHRALRRRIIEMMLWKMKARPDSAAIEKIMHLSLCGTNGTELHFPERIRIARQNDALLLTRLPAERGPRDNLQQVVDIDQEIPGPGTYKCSPLAKRLIIRKAPKLFTAGETSLFVDGHKLSFPLTLRLPVPGERFYPKGGQGSRKIARYLNDRKIPKHQRIHYPVLVSQEEVVCVLGLAVDERYGITDETTGVINLDWVRGYH